jgi:hypothetical protein
MCQKLPLAGDLLDHLIGGGKQLVQHVEAERLGTRKQSFPMAMRAPWPLPEKRVFGPAIHM